MVLKNFSKDKILLGLVVGILLFLLSFPLEKLYSSGNGKADTADSLKTSGTGSLQYQKELEEQLEALLEKVQEQDVSR